MIKVKNDKDKKNYLFDGKKKFDCEVVERHDYWLEEERCGIAIIFNKKEEFDYALKNANRLENYIINLAIDSYVNWKGVNVLAQVDFEAMHRTFLDITFDKHWSWEFSISEYFIEFARIKGYESAEIEFEEDIERHMFSVKINDYWNISGAKKSAFKIFQELFSVVEKFHNEAVKRLDTHNSDNFLAAFIFPEELKIPCEQYLLYFAQFLQDLGINATPNLKEEAGKVLFSVTPTDDQEALDKIREALAVYLNLPSSPIVYDESFAALRLKAEIERLQSSQRITEMEFRVTQKALESQDKIILQQSVLLEQQAKVIEKITDKAIMINSAENKEELEEVFEGIKVGKSKFLMEQIGVHLNPVTAIKTIGRKLSGGDDEIISLKIND